MQAKVRIVLVEPREGGNVGAVARVMMNFGLDDLVLVGQPPPLKPVAEWWASGADELLQSMRFTATLEEALEDCHLTIATTSARARVGLEPMTPRSIAALGATLPEAQRIAIVFGRENRGLTVDEVAVCQRTAIIPTSPRLPTMNLAQSVGIFAYELRHAPEISEVQREPAPAELVERLHQRIRQLLLEAGYLHEENPERMLRELRRMAGRALLDQREVEILLGMLRQVEWKVRHGSRQ